jgi:ligand-binding sensor domain-containing protein/two-component sensor histidine kinase
MPAGYQLAIGALSADRNGVIWAATNFGACAFDPRTGGTRFFNHDSTNPQTLSTNTVHVVLQEGPRAVWIGTMDGMNRLDPATGEVKRYASRSNRLLRREHDVIYSIAIDSMRNVWVATFGGLLRWDEPTGSFRPFHARIAPGLDLGTEAFINTLFCGADGTLWVGTMHYGLIRLDPRTGAISQHRHDDTNPRSMDSDRVTCILEDRSGVVWAATYRVGVNKYDRRRDPFVHYPVKSAVYSILRDAAQSLWVGTTGALYRFSPGKQQPEVFVANTKQSSGLKGPEVYSMLGDPSGNFWVGSNAGLERYDAHRGTFSQYDFPRPEKPNNPTVKSMLRDHDGTLWFGTYVPDLIHLDPRTGSSVLYRHDPKKPGSLPAGEVWSLFRDSKNRLWIGTFGGGLGLYHDSTDTFTTFLNKKDDPNSIASNGVYSIAEDIHGTIWIGTFGSGLNAFNPEKPEWTLYSVQDGLPDNFVKTVTPDRHGNLWLSTDKGLSYFDPARRLFRNLKEKDGLHGNIFLSGSIFRADDGRLFFGGMEGVTSFHPDSLTQKTYVPPIRISSFKVLEKTAPLPAGEVILPYNENSFSFEFVALDYSLPAKNQYAYRLDGLDHDWIQAGTRRYASYTKVPPGRYTFRVKGSNSDGVWNEVGTSLAITVVPAFWQTWWFRVLGITALIGGIAAAYQYRVRRLLEIERLRVRIASDLHDDIGSSLTKISLQSELIQEGIDPGEQQNYLRNISAMSRELVTSMSDIVWSIDARNDTVESLLDKMRSFGASTLSAKDIDFTLAVTGLDPKKRLPVDVRENIYLIYKEAINNIAKHSGATRVEVKLDNGSSGMKMSVSDNGRGWGGTARPSGHGTKNMAMRAERLGGSVEIRKENGTHILLRTRPL